MTVREGLQIEISGIPAENGKCRVETQLKITLQLKNAQGEIVKDWKQLRLPHPLIAKEKHRMEKFNGRNKHIQDTEILTLDAKLVCDHDMTKTLECCDNCIGRERKRAHRRKESQKLPGPLSSIPVFGSVNCKTGESLLEDESIPPTPTDPVEYQAWERKRIMVFSSTEYVDLSSGQCLLPTRITCYCRHHNEKVGFRIQFTAKDSTGVALASVLTHPVMMMDDHKSGKRATPAQPKSAGETSSSSRKKSAAENVGTSTITGSTNKLNKVQNHEYDNEDMDQDEGFTEDQDEIDLEAGHHIPQHSYSGNDMKFEDSEMLSGDVLSPLSSTMDRINAKRRVDENTMEDIQTQLFTDPTRGPFRRKTSHDVAPGSAGETSLFTSSVQSFPPSNIISSQSPFIPGSLFAIEGHNSPFTSSLSHTLVAGGSFLDQKNIDMFIQGSLTTSPTAPRGEIANGHSSKNLPDHDASMMEFTTLDESMSSSHDISHTFSTSALAADMSATKPGQAQDQSMSVESQTLGMRTPFSVPISNYSAPPTTIAAPTVTSNPSSSAGMFTSAFSSTFSSPLNGSISVVPTSNSSGMSSSFLDASQMQEFQNFKKQSMLQQEQQRLLLQLQRGVQQQNQQPIEPKQVPWTAPNANNKDPFWNMKMAISQTTDPTSSAFIPTSTSIPEDDVKDVSSKSMADSNDIEISGTAEGASFAPKKRGRPRKTVPSSSEADSPVFSPKTLSDLPPSPSPPPAFASSSSAAAATAAQYLLFQQHQQQQLQHHQQQLQQQQKQAILARQKPRVQKVIPSRGPVEGGTEITLLGSGFYPGMVPTFDGVSALSVQYYGAETVICRLPPRAFPGAVVVKAQNPMSALAGSAIASGPGATATGSNMKEGSNNNDLVRTMTQLFGGPSSTHGGSLLDDDVGALFEYEESKGDRDLIALALQVLGMKMNGRVEPPHQVAMRIMGTAAASNAIIDQGANFSQAQLQLPQSQSQLQLLQQTPQSLIGFGGLQANSLQQNLLSQQLIQQQAQLQQHIQPQQQQQQSLFGSLPVQSTSTSNDSIFNPGMNGSFGNFMNSMGGPNGGSH
ncbi:hypothetical protein BGX27_000353 [Mortierella sp. AM989]|nr:hypothetical protein BGX27_000353 [Mortierella sp. AM989]